MKTTTKIVTIRQYVHIRVTDVLLDQREADSLQEFVYLAADDGDEHNEQARGVDAIISHDAVAYTARVWASALHQQPFDETERAIVDALTNIDTDVFYIRFPRP